MSSRWLCKHEASHQTWWSNSHVLILEFVYVWMLSQEVNCLQNQCIILVWQYITSSLSLWFVASGIYGPEYTIVCPLVGRGAWSKLFIDINSLIWICWWPCLFQLRRPTEREKDKMMSCCRGWGDTIKERNKVGKGDSAVMFYSLCGTVRAVIKDWLVVMWSCCHRGPYATSRSMPQTLRILFCHLSEATSLSFFSLCRRLFFILRTIKWVPCDISALYSYNMSGGLALCQRKKKKANSVSH